MGNTVNTANQWLDLDKLSANPGDNSFIMGIVYTILKYLLFFCGVVALIIGIGRTACDYIFIANQPLFIRINEAKEMLRNGGAQGQPMGGNPIANAFSKVGGFVGSQISNSGLAQGLGISFIALVVPDISMFTSYANENGGGFNEEGKQKIKMGQWFMSHGLQSIAIMLIGLLMASGLAANMTKVAMNAGLMLAQKASESTNVGSFINAKMGTTDLISDEGSTVGDAMVSNATKQVFSALSSNTKVAAKDKQNISTALEAEISKLFDAEFNQGTAALSDNGTGLGKYDYYTTTYDTNSYAIAVDNPVIEKVKLNEQPKIISESAITARNKAIATANANSNAKKYTRVCNFRIPLDVETYISDVADRSTYSQFIVTFKVTVKATNIDIAISGNVNQTPTTAPTTAASTP